jgi:hypothetical protein
MIMTFMAPMAQANEYYSFEAEAEALYELGLYQGLSNTEFVPDLGSNLDRQTGTVMLVRMFGEEDDAKKLGYDEARALLDLRFADANEIDEWAVRQVAYGVLNGYIKGYPKAEGEDKAWFY